MILGSKQLVRVVRGQRVGGGVIRRSLCKTAKWCSYCILHSGDKTEPTQGWGRGVGGSAGLEQLSWKTGKADLKVPGVS